jgi:hypothetical protein
MTGVKTDVDVEMRAMKYDRYKCKYAAPYPGKLFSYCILNILVKYYRKAIH